MDSTTLQIVWTAATDNVAVTGYRLDVSTTNSFTSFIPGYNDANVGNVTSTSVTGFSPSTTYYARVRASDAAGNVSTNSTSAFGTTLAPPDKIGRASCRERV